MYLALYRKYRPRTFSEVISQPHIVAALKNQLKSGQISHAYLFTGSRGTGKTSCAKILAKAVNCLDLRDGDPCLECEACRAADNSPDIAEIDAASNNGVDDIRDLRGEAGYLPTELKRKVYIIDEVHMLSASAFNALLKTLEEPPAHVIFILATTESHKIPATVLSRCQRFGFNRINADESADALVRIAEKEGFSLDKDAALLISRLSDGGMRDALSLLDVAACENKAVTADLVREVAGVAGKSHLFAIADAVSSGDGKAALTITAELYSRSKDPARLLEELLQHFRNLMIAKLMPGDSSLLNALPDEIPEYKRQAELFALGEIMRCLDIIEEGLKRKGGRTEAEICLMKMALPTSPATPATAPVMPAPIPVRVPEQAKPVPAPVPEPTALEPVVPFAEWEKVLDKLDAFRASMLEETEAGVSGDKVVVRGAPPLKYFFDNAENINALTAVIAEVTGKRANVAFEVGEVKPKHANIDVFLKEAENLGVKVKII